MDAAVVTAPFHNNLQSVAQPGDLAYGPGGRYRRDDPGGHRWNVVAENSYMTGTTRCFSNEVWETFEERMERVIKGTAEAYRAEAELEYRASCPPTVNDEAVVSIAQKIRDCCPG